MDSDGARRSKATRAGLVFPVGRIHKMMRLRKKATGVVSSAAAVCMTAALEVWVKEALHMAVKHNKAKKGHLSTVSIEAALFLCPDVFAVISTPLKKKALLKAQIAEEREAVVLEARASAHEAEGLVRALATLQRCRASYEKMKVYHDLPALLQEIVTSVPFLAEAPGLAAARAALQRYFAANAELERMATFNESLIEERDRAVEEFSAAIGRMEAWHDLVDDCAFDGFVGLQTSLGWVNTLGETSSSLLQREPAKVRKNSVEDKNGSGPEALYVPRPEEVAPDKFLPDEEVEDVSASRPLNYWDDREQEEEEEEEEELQRAMFAEERALIHDVLEEHREWSHSKATSWRNVSADLNAAGRAMKVWFGRMAQAAEAAADGAVEEEREEDDLADWENELFTAMKFVGSANSSIAAFEGIPFHHYNRLFEACETALSMTRTYILERHSRMREYLYLQHQAAAIGALQRPQVVTEVGSTVAAAERLTRKWRRLKMLRENYLEEIDDAKAGEAPEEEMGSLTKVLAKIENEQASMRDGWVTALLAAEQVTQSLVEHLHSFPELRFMVPGVGWDNRRYLGRLLSWDASLCEFTITKVLSGRLEGSPSSLLMAKRDGQPILIKRYLLKKTTIPDFLVAMNELQRLEHPFLGEATKIFFSEDGTFGHVELEWSKECHRYRQWCAKGASEGERLRALRQLLQALSHLHSEGQAHGSVKPSNALLNRHGAAFLACPELPSSLGDRAPGASLSSLLFAAPEVLLAETAPSAAADIYSFGLVLFDAFFPRLPNGSLQRPLCVDVANRTKKIRIPEHPNTLVKDLLPKMLAFSPAKRPSAEEVLQHPLFSSVCEAAAPAEGVRLDCICAVTCEEAGASQRGIQCSAGHFLCDGDLGKYVKSFAREKSEEVLVGWRAEVPCPLSSCTATYPFSLLANHLKPATLKDCVTMRKRVKALLMVTPSLPAGLADLESVFTVLADEVSQKRAQILFQTLLLLCPRCRNIFMGFVGSLVSQCTCCSSHFCSLCSLDCGSKPVATRHMRRCAASVTADPEVVSAKQFQDLKRKRQQTWLSESLLAITDEDFRAKVAESVEQDVERIGLEAA